MTTKIKAVITPTLITIRMGSTVSEAQALMKLHRIRHLPVVDEEKQIVGVLSNTDVQNGLLPSSINVEFLMNSPVDSMDQNTSLRAAILKMLEKKISSLLITDKSDEVVGIVTTDDLLWHLAQVLQSEAPEHKPLLSAMNLQTLGKVAHDLSNFGI